jgi:hypothetical protein
MSKMDRNIVFCPHPGPQTAFVECPVFEIVYGGARGGGKTYGCLGEFIIHGQQFGGLAKGLFLRRTRESLKDAIREAKVLYRDIATWKATKNEFHFKSGAVLVFNYLDRDEDAENYQGHQYTRIYIEELTQFPDPAPVMKMLATLRSAHGVNCQFRASCNPGGPGHNWVKARYVDNGAFNVVVDDESGLDRVFIPARIKDNPSLLANDPNYIGRLKLAGNEQLVKAWLDGNWDVIQGAFFSEWDPSVHILDHKTVMQSINGDWRFFMSGDWGSASPFAFGWYGIIPDEFFVGMQKIPRGAIIRIREYYGNKPGAFNKGLKMPAEKVCTEVKKRTKEKLLYGVLDPSAFKQDGGPSVAERMASSGARFRRADNRRVARKGSFGGWDICRFRLLGRDDTPMFYVTEASPHFIRSVPVIQHDKSNIEDLNTEAEDHIADEWRYAMMSRPWLPSNAGHIGKQSPFTAENAFIKAFENVRDEPKRIVM